MSRKKIVIAAAAVVIAAVVGGIALERRQGDHAGHAHAAGEQSSIYYCPMHPTVTSDEPGSCPICGMKLVRRSGSQSSDVASQLAQSGSIEGELPAISLPPNQRVMANVRTIRAVARPVTASFVATGTVTFDQRRVAQVTSYTAGRIEQLFANFIGDEVRRGAAVATVYSPELYATQRELLVAVRSGRSELIEAARRRLRLFGMPESEIRQVIASGNVRRTSTIVSPVSGVVTQKLAVPQQYVAEGEAIVEVADLSTVWVEADVFESDLPRVAVGQRVVVTSPALAAELPGEIAFIEPVVGSQTRAVRVRIEIANRNLQLKPGMYVSVRIDSGGNRSAVMLPSTAVIDRGNARFVWIEVAPGEFAPRRVVTGSDDGESIEIVSGVAPGEQVVVEGAFLLDSEAQLRSATGVSP